MSYDRFDKQRRNKSYSEHINLFKNTFLDRQRAIRWLRRLYAPPTDPEETQIRDQYMYFLLIQLQNGELKGPFQHAPSHGARLSLSKIHKLDHESTNTVST